MFEHVWEKYIDEYVAIENEESTLISIVKRGNARIIPYFKGKYIEDINASDIHDFLISMRDVPSQANRCRSALSKLFNLCELPWLYREKNTNPCQSVVRYKEYSRDRYLSDDELKRLITVLDMLIEEGLVDYYKNNHSRSLYRVRVACYFKLLIYTGARGVEWRTLKIDRIDLTRMIIRPKTKNKEPAVSIPPEIVETIKLLLELPRDNSNSYLFPGIYIPCMAYPKDLWYEIKAMAKIENINPHDMRHSWAAFALASGLSLTDVGQQLNHRSYQTTKRYEHLADAVKSKNVAIVGKAIKNISSGAAKVVDIREKQKVA